MKSLFIPLKTEFYEGFRDGTKTEEYRCYGPRWNERTCFVGRTVVLSKGYGKANRMNGRVVGFTVSSEPTKSEAWKTCYGEKPGLVAACIKIEVLDNK